MKIFKKIFCGYLLPLLHKIIKPALNFDKTHNQTLLNQIRDSFSVWCTSFTFTLFLVSLYRTFLSHRENNCKKLPFLYLL